MTHELAANGWTIYVETLDEQTGLKHRRPIEPGRFGGEGDWEPTDLARESAELRKAALQYWTAEVVGAFKARFPWVPPAEPTADEIRAETFKADPTRVDLLARPRTATPAQIDAYVEANVTNLAQARGMFRAVLKLIALDGRQ
jgi:hypothetical protein